MKRELKTEVILKAIKKVFTLNDTDSIKWLELHSTKINTNYIIDYGTALDQIEKLKHHKLI